VLINETAAPLDPSSKSQKEIFDKETRETINLSEIIPTMFFPLNEEKIHDLKSIFSAFIK
jgi:hypothetical protein